MSTPTDHRTHFDNAVLDTGEVPERNEIYALIQRANVAFEALGAQHRRCLTINAHERLALMHLWESGSITMSELGERIPLSRAAVTALTDRLERMGYVIRTPDEHDRRRTMLTLTTRPAEIVQPVAQPFIDGIKAAAADLDEDEWATVCGFMARVYDSSIASARHLQKLTDDELHELVEEGQRAQRARA
jgi:DNA-binding MarR family transcriptional regulator